MQRQCRPGERMVAGQVLIFDLGALNDYIAEQDHANAPADMSTVTDDELRRLQYSATRYFWLSRDEGFARRVSAEMARRVAQ